MSARVILPEQEFAGYIFDLDGTLVDSMPVHYRAWRWALQKHGCPHHVFQWAEFVAHGGMAAPDIVADLNATYGLEMEPEVVAEEKRERYAWLLLNEHRYSHCPNGEYCFSQQSFSHQAHRGTQLQAMASVSCCHCP